MAKFTIPRADYRAFPFSLTQRGVALDMAGYTFVFTLKKRVKDGDDLILSEKIIQIPSGSVTKSALFEIEADFCDHAPGDYWLVIKKRDYIWKQILR